MSWVIAIAGFMALIVLHEAGHFAAAKAVGMRVERFSLFFWKAASFTRGETEYQIGWLPLGGYVKITGMTPDEVAGLSPELAARAYYNKAPWKRIVVILAGPGVNLLIALVLFTAVLASGSLDGATAIGNLSSQQTVNYKLSGAVIEHTVAGSAARGVLRAHDTLLTIDGRPITTSALDSALGRTRCAGAPTNGCVATSAVTLKVRRGQQTLTFALRPHYDAKTRRMLLGISYQPTSAIATSVINRGLGSSFVTASSALWDVASSSVSNYVHAFTSAKVRKQFSSIIGITQTTQQAVVRGPGFALVVLGLISLVLAVVNLFPFLPLDGGHVLWSVAEKIRGKRVSLTAMWRYSSVGIVLLSFLVINGVSNDISRLGG